MFISADGWIHCPQPNLQADLRLFCFPAGGGRASHFYTWPDYVPASIEVWAVQLPGRDVLPAEVPDRALPGLISAIAEAIHTRQDRPLAFFGHSAGCLLAFEVARYLRSHYLTGPIHLSFSCFPALHLPRSVFPLFLLPEAELAEHILVQSNSFSSNDEQAKLAFMSLLQKDITYFEQYCYQTETPFSCPITVFGGWQDQVISHHHLFSWKTHTTGEFSIHMFSGDHFFIHAEKVSLLKIIVEQLSICMP